MSDLSLNDTLDPLENTNTNTNIEDWESVIDFEMKNNEEDSNLEGSNEHELVLGNRLQAEQESLGKEDGVSMEIENETSLGMDSTGAAHDESNNAMALEKNSNNETGDKINHLDGTTTVSQAPASAVDLHATADVHVPTVPKQLFQRLLESYRPLEEMLISFE